jgi:hypothetical protein
MQNSRSHPQFFCKNEQEKSENKQGTVVCYDEIKFHLCITVSF